MPPTSSPTPTQALCPSPSPLPESPESADRAEEVGADASAAAAGGPVPAPQRQRTAPGEAAPGGAEVPRGFRTRKGQTDAAHMDALDMLGGWTVFSLREGSQRKAHSFCFSGDLVALLEICSINPKAAHPFYARNEHQAFTFYKNALFMVEFDEAGLVEFGRARGGSPKTFWPSCSLGLFMF